MTRRRGNDATVTPVSDNATTVNGDLPAEIALDIESVSAPADGALAETAEVAASRPAKR